MFRILIRYVTFTFDDAFSSVDACGVFFFKAEADFINNIMTVICLQIITGYCLMFLCIILSISVGCKSKLKELHFFFFFFRAIV